MPTVAELLRAAEERLVEKGIPEARREAASLLSFAIKRDRTFLIAHPEYVLSGPEEEFFSAVVRRRSEREPFHYITGIKEFYGLEFVVSPAVLIPRPETEMLVERSIALLADCEKPAFCEVGVGSGCISISVLANLLNASAVGLEISDDAIAVAGTNAERHHVSSQFDVRRSDLFEGLAAGERFDLIISNPPYVPAADIAELEPEVREYEPRAALTDGGGGLSVVGRLIRESPQYLKPGGTLMLEIGIGQAGRVREMISPDIWASVTVDDDFQGIPRVVAATLANT